MDATSPAPLEDEVRSALEAEGDVRVADLHVWEISPGRRGVLAALYSSAPREPRHYREVIVLCELNSLPYHEAAQVIGCRVGTIRSRLNRARTLLIERCRQCFCPTRNAVRGQAESPALRGRARILSPESGR